MSTGGEELKIKMVLDVSQADAAQKKQGKGFENLTRQADASAKSMGKALDRQAVAQKALDDARVKGFNRARDAQGKFVAGTKQAGDEGAASFGKIGLSITVMQAGLSKAMEIANAFGQAMNEAAERYKKLTANFTSDRDKLAELANIMGRPADNNFTVENAKFNAKVGFKFDEGLDFRSAYRNSGEQFKGKTISDSEHAQFEEQSAALAVARKIGPKEAGDFAGTVLGFKDRTKLGDRASEDALGKVNSSLAILGAGGGDTSTLVDQAKKISAATLNEDSMRGAFTDSDEVATVASVAAEKSDKTAAEQIEAANRGLRDFHGKKSEDILKRAMIDPTTKFMDAIRRLAPVVEADAKAKGVKVQDILRESFEDSQTAEAIGVQINKGVYGGLYDARAKTAAENQGGDKALKVIAESEGTERVQDRKADADQKLAEDRIGAEGSKVDILRKQAIKQLTEEEEIGTTWATLKKYASKSINLGTADTESEAIYRRMGKIEAERGKAAGVEVEVPRYDFTLHTAERDRDIFNEAIGKVEAAGGSGTRDMTAEQIKEQRETNRLLKRNNELLEAQARARRPTTPAPPIVALTRTATPAR